MAEEREGEEKLIRDTRKWRGKKEEGNNGNSFSHLHLALGAG